MYTICLGNAQETCSSHANSSKTCSFHTQYLCMYFSLQIIQILSSVWNHAPQTTHLVQYLHPYHLQSNNRRATHIWVLPGVLCNHCSWWTDIRISHNIPCACFSRCMEFAECQTCVQQVSSNIYQNQTTYRFSFVGTTHKLITILQSFQFVNSDLHQC